VKEFFQRLVRIIAELVKRFIRDNPDNPYEAAAFRAVREVASIYARRVVIVR
jgi:hypothetical protein